VSTESKLAELVAQLDTANAEKAELTLRIKRGELIDVRRLESGIVTRAHAVRDLLMHGMPARVGATLATDHHTEPSLTIVTLTATMRRFLTAIAQRYRDDHPPKSRT
jgi:hypothetical protein